MNVTSSSYGNADYGYVYGHIALAPDNTARLIFHNHYKHNNGEYYVHGTVRYKVAVVPTTVAIATDSGNWVSGSWIAYGVVV
jgi:hypothetical protein